MSYTGIEGKLKVEARALLTKLVGHLLADGSISPEDAPFSFGLPGEDPHFHELVNDLVAQTYDFMVDTAHDMACN